MNNKYVQRTRIKICGITTPETAKYAAKEGVDAIGLVFYKDSKRKVTLTQAAAIIEQVPLFTSKVALFVNPQKRLVEEVISALDLDILQFHGDETEAFCCQFRKPYIKALPAKSQQFLESQILLYPTADAVLIDTFKTSQFGGTGDSFNWSWFPKSKDKVFILAGGLNAGNVQQAILQTSPYAVDVSTGVESSAGQKSNEKIKQFISKVNDVPKR